jgi:hypothetical protein
VGPRIPLFFPTHSVLALTCAPGLLVGVRVDDADAPRSTRCAASPSGVSLPCARIPEGILLALLEHGFDAPLSVGASTGCLWPVPATQLARNAAVSLKMLIVMSHFASSLNLPITGLAQETFSISHSVRPSSTTRIASCSGPMRDTRLSAGATGEPEW